MRRRRRHAPVNRVLAGFLSIVASHAAAAAGAQTGSGSVPFIRVPEPDAEYPIHAFRDELRCGSVSYKERVADALAAEGDDAIAALIEALHAPRYATREGSMGALARMGGPALSCMRALIHTSMECDPPPPGDRRKRSAIEGLIADLPASSVDGDSIPPLPRRLAATAVVHLMTYAATSMEDRVAAARARMLADLERHLCDGRKATVRREAIVLETAHGEWDEGYLVTTRVDDRSGRPVGEFGWWCGEDGVASFRYEPIKATKI
ncbi:MAG: hypothetical protein U0166_11235 [Acidobacteriota bacterium]